ncbi:MAG: hypothetical protein NXI31_24415 [bacterium]|nr:hypothetical protein [bacterium]
MTPAITDIAAEAALTQMLRDEPAHAVVHAGVGAAGSPNLLWIAARMGSVGIAVVRASEVVCQRGDLVHQDGAACAKFDDGDRCAACCSGSWFRRARAVDLLNRLDLFVAGLQSSALVLLPTADDPAVLEAVGVPKRSLRTAVAEDLAATVASELPELVAPVAFRGD